MSTVSLTTADPLSHSDAAGGVPLGGRVAPAAAAPSSRETRDRETDRCVAELAACDDPAREVRLRDELVRWNLPVATALAHRYRNRGESMDDLTQVAYVGLCAAARRFDPAAGSFHGFCVPTVLGELRRHFRDRGWVVRPPRRIQEVQQRVVRAQSEMCHDLGREPSAEEVAERVGCQPKEVREANSVRSCYVPTSLDRQLVPDGDASLQDLLTSERDDGSSAEARAVLGPAVRRLAERDRQILRMRFFEDLTQREIAETIGVTQMQVSRVLTRIFADLRADIGTT